MSERDRDALRRQILELTAQYHAAAHPGAPFQAGHSSVPVSGRVYGAEEMVSLVDSALDFWLTTGRFNDAFEKRLGAVLGLEHARTVNSGSSANLVAFAALTSEEAWEERAIAAGDEMITVASGFPTTINPALLYGVVPVFVDVTLPTFNIDVAQLEAALSPKTRAIMVAHTLGNPFDLDAVTAFAERHGLFLIEDCCDALGSTWNGRPVGGFGDAGTLSFYPAHHITMGEGGAVFTANRRMAKAMESIRDWGRSCYCPPGQDNTCGMRFQRQLGELPFGYDHKYTYSHLGFNLKITDMQAAVGLAQLDRLPDFIAVRKRNFASLKAGLIDLPQMVTTAEALPQADPAWFGFPLMLREGLPFTREDLMRELEMNNIGSRLLFGGNLMRQPYMAGRPCRKVGELVNTDAIMHRALWIGTYPGLDPARIDFIIEILHAFAQRHGVAG